VYTLCLSLTSGKPVNRFTIKRADQLCRGASMRIVRGTCSSSLSTSPAAQRVLNSAACLIFELSTRDDIALVSATVALASSTTASLVQTLLCRALSLLQNVSTVSDKHWRVRWRRRPSSLCHGCAQSSLNVSSHMPVPPHGTHCQ